MPTATRLSFHTEYVTLFTPRRLRRHLWRTSFAEGRNAQPTHCETGLTTVCISDPGAWPPQVKDGHTCRSANQRRRSYYTHDTHVGTSLPPLPALSPQFSPNCPPNALHLRTADKSVCQSSIRDELYTDNWYFSYKNICPYFDNTATWTNLNCQKCAVVLSIKYAAYAFKYR